MNKSIFFELLLISAVVLWIVFQVGKYYGRHKGNKAILIELKQHLHNLTPEEKIYLSSLLIDDENTQCFKIENGISEALEKKKIIYKSNNVEDIESGVVYSIQPWAKDYLVKNPHLLEGENQILQESSGSTSQF